MHACVCVFCSAENVNRLCVASSVVVVQQQSAAAAAAEPKIENESRINFVCSECNGPLYFQRLCLRIVRLNLLCVRVCVEMLISF